jgi:hypothetical protein
MGRRFVVTFENVAVTAAQDLIAVAASSTKSLILRSAFIGQSSDAADAQDEQLRIRIVTGHTTVGSGGNSFTPLPLDNTSTAGFTSRINDTTAASSGTAANKHCDVFNVRAGWVYRPTPEEIIEIPGGARLEINLPVAPADSLTMSGTAIFEEIG